MDARSLVGVWKRVPFHMKDTEDNFTYPFGPNAVGYYVLAARGYGSVSLMRKDRRTFNSGDIFGGTTDEFAGRYEVREERLVLHAEVTFFPNWVGMDQIRFVSMKDDSLTLGSMLILASGKQQNGTSCMGEGWIARLTAPQGGLLTPTPGDLDERHRKFVVNRVVKRIETLGYRVTLEAASPYFLERRTL